MLTENTSLSNALEEVGTESSKLRKIHASTLRSYVTRFTKLVDCTSRPTVALLGIKQVDTWLYVHWPTFFNLLASPDCDPSTRTVWTTWVKQILELFPEILKISCPALVTPLDVDEGDEFFKALSLEKGKAAALEDFMRRQIQAQEEFNRVFLSQLFVAVFSATINHTYKPVIQALGAKRREMLDIPLVPGGGYTLFSLNKLNKPKHYARCVYRVPIPRKILKNPTEWQREIMTLQHFIPEKALEWGFRTCADSPTLADWDLSVWLRKSTEARDVDAFPFKFIDLPPEARPTLHVEACIEDFMLKNSKLLVHSTPTCVRINLRKILLNMHKASPTDVGPTPSQGKFTNNRSLSSSTRLSHVVVNVPVPPVLWHAGFINLPDQLEIHVKHRRGTYYFGFPQLSGLFDLNNSCPELARGTCKVKNTPMFRWDVINLITGTLICDAVWGTNVRYAGGCPSIGHFLSNLLCEYDLAEMNNLRWRRLAHSATYEARALDDNKQHLGPIAYTEIQALRACMMEYQQSPLPMKERKQILHTALPMRPLPTLEKHIRKMQVDAFFHARSGLADQGVYDEAKAANPDTPPDRTNTFMENPYMFLASQYVISNKRYQTTQTNKRKRDVVIQRMIDKHVPLNDSDQLGDIPSYYHPLCDPYVRIEPFQG